MEQFLTRFTLGFLMAQLFPGAVAIAAVSCPFVARTPAEPKTISELVLHIGNLWFSSARGTITFLFLSGATGMLIHGVAWATMAWIESGRARSEPGSVFDSKWHQVPLYLQLLIAPTVMIWELITLLSCPKLESLAMEENAPFIAPADKPLFDFLQFFYLYFAQFYVHLAYALVMSLFSLSVTWMLMGWTIRRVLVLVVVYAFSSVLFLVGRTQFASLFRGEMALRRRCSQMLQHKVGEANTEFPGEE